MGTAAARWDELQGARQSFLDMAIDCSHLTIPSLIPDSDYVLSRTDARLSRKLYQSLGSRGLSNIAAKMLLALLPPGQPFFRLMMDKAAIEREASRRGEQVENLMTKVDSFLSQQEWLVLRSLDKMKARATLFEALKHLACGGTALLYVGPKFLKMYGLRSIAGERDAEDNVHDIVIREQLSKANMPKVAQRMINRAERKTEAESLQQYDLYTHITFDPQGGNKAVEWYQEYGGNMLSGTAGFSSLDKSPWLPLRLNKVSGSFYGTGLIEEVLGDLQTFNALSKAIVQGGLGSSKTVGLVNPNGVTRADALNRAENFDFVTGDINDVGFLRVEKQNDYATGLQTMQMIERRLNYAFMLTEAVQRDAERVTAQEVTLLARQLEESKGGIYTLLSDELQLPLIRRVLHVLGSTGQLQELPEGLVEPAVTTGIDAIGRGQDEERLGSFIGFATQAIPNVVGQFIQPLEVLSRMAAAKGIDPKGLLKTQEELTADMQQAQQLQLASQLATNQSNVNPQIPPAGATGPGATGPAGGAGPGGGVPVTDPVAA